MTSSDSADKSVKPAKLTESVEHKLKASAKVSKDKNKKNTSLRLDKKTLKALKMVAIEQETSVQKLIEGLIEDFLNNRAQ
ncbi:hypothetical protein [Litoribrevibacter albus]|uniref:Ribbon-helix-helix protein, CopG family n=1 Tax=Litoribrevibacter albus TaxID=1473156 RepID=A0AA37SAS9_9GAMM|nr:hypothetical protein [Litoribrevibacter albus]GLQ32482.1 hypothetical protein GCM10007876_29610 [Litoribrevibacter albus]